MRERPLHIAAAAAFGDSAGMIAAFRHYAPVSVERVMNVHAAFWIVQAGDSSIGPLRHGAAIPGLRGGVAVRSRIAASDVRGRAWRSSTAIGGGTV
jgi:hypothetical protein